jgi:dTDP-4-dehydrorhamnose 3,5-epimerase
MTPGKDIIFRLKVIPTRIPDVLVIEPEVFDDTRGFFYESFNQMAFNHATGLDVQFVQDNHSRNTKGVMRGLHYQLPPHAQGKLVRVVRGAVWDVAVDIRKSSLTFGEWTCIELTEDNHKQHWIPPGFAHGFMVLSETADFLYKTTDYYVPSLDRCIAWNDSTLAVQWPYSEGELLLSSKDLTGKLLQESELFK